MIVLIALFSIIGFILDKKYLKYKQEKTRKLARAKYRNLFIATYALAEDNYIRS